MADTITPQPMGNNQAPNLKMEFSHDFKSVALWLLLGTVAGVAIGVWLCKSKITR